MNRTESEKSVGVRPLVIGGALFAVLFTIAFSVILRWDRTEALVDALRRDDVAAVTEATDDLDVAIPFPGFARRLRPLEWALLQGSEEVIGALIDAGADPELVEVDGKGPMQLAIERESLSVVHKLLNAGVSASSPDYNGDPPLAFAVRHTQTDIATVLLEHGAPVDARDQFGYAALHHAAIESLPEAVQVLIEWGANVNQPDRDRGYTPLTYALRRSRLDIARMLLAAGADPSIRSSSGATTLMTVIGFCEGTRVLDFVFDLGIDVNAVSDPAGGGTTAIGIAAEFGRPWEVEWLLAHGADPDPPDLVPAIDLARRREDGPDKRTILLLLQEMFD